MLHSHSHAHHHHGHHHGIAKHASEKERRTQEKKLVTVLGLMVAFVLLQVTGAWWSGSLALFADAGHLSMDAIAILLTYLSFRMGRRRANVTHSYGYRRVEILAALMNSISMIAMAVWIFVEGCLRLLHHPVVQGSVMIWVSLGAVALHTFILFFLRSEGNLNLRAALLHVLWDLMGAVGTLVAGVLIHFTHQFWIDSALSILLSCFLLRTTIVLVREVWHILMEGTPRHIDIHALKQEVMGVVQGVQDVHHVHVWSLTNEETILTMHVVCERDADVDMVLTAIKTYLLEQHAITHTTIQIERGQECVDDVVSQHITHA